MQTLLNIIISLVWVLNIALMTAGNVGFEVAWTLGLIGGAFVGAIMFVLDQWVSAEAIFEIKEYYVLSISLGWLAFMLCVTLLRLQLFI